MNDATQRFSNRVENYLKYRPHYPKAVVETLQADCQLTPASVIADIGSGTGLLSELFLENGNPVFAVEPNPEMRQAGERLLRNHAHFQSVAGRAEATNLANHSVDFVTAGQAFHWFDRDQARQEFQRILKPTGWVMLVWNERDIHATPFLMAYEQLLFQYAPQYAQVDHRHVNEAVLATFYGAKGFQTRTFRNQQAFDYAGVCGRLLSSSYAPEAGHANHEAMLAELLEIFQAHQDQGRVAFDYLTRAYFGQLQ